MTVGALERALARLRPAPVHERTPVARTDPRRAAKAALDLLLAPASAAGSLWRAAGGSGGPPDPAAVRSMAFIKLDHLGDVLMATPLMRALKAWAPHATLTVYARPASAEPLPRLSCVDEVELADVPWIRPGTPLPGNVRACLALARELKARRFDLAVDLRYHNRLDSLLLSLSGARIRLGFDAGGCGFGLTHVAPMPRRGHEIDRGAGALRKFGISVDRLDPEFPLRPEELGKASRLLRRGRRVVALHVGAGNPVKRWMPERFAWVARELARRGRARVAVLAGTGEEKLGDAVMRALPRPSALDLRGRLTVGEMAAVIASSRLFLGNDGGAAHVAAAVGTPSVVVFSGTNVASEWAPRGSRVRVLERWVPCKPCRSATCPFDQACLREVGVDDVLEAALLELAG